MATPQTYAREWIMGLLDGSNIAVRYGLPAPLVRWNRELPLEFGEESAYPAHPFELMPITMETGKSTTSDQDKDTRHRWRLRVGFFCGASYHDLAAEMEEWEERLLRLINTSVNWNHGIQTGMTGIERCLLLNVEYVFARPPDRRALLRGVVECDLTRDWTVPL